MSTIYKDYFYRVIVFMIILLLVNTINFKCESYNDCSTRDEFIIFFIQKHLKSFPNIELHTEKCYPHLPSGNNTLSTIHGLQNKKQIYDHAIYINSLGFPTPHLIKQIRDITKYSVSTVCRSSKNYKGEDYDFTYAKHNKQSKEIFIKIPFDPDIYKPDKEDNELLFLIQKSNSVLDIKATLNSIKKLMNSNVEIKYTIGILSLQKVEYINTSHQVLETVKFKKYVDYIKLLRKANFYFISDSTVDYFTLYELTACRTLIISLDRHVNFHKFQDIHIYTHNGALEWSKIFSQVNSRTATDTLRQTHDSTWDGVVARIIGALEMYEKNHKPRVINNLYPVKYYLNINKKSKPNSVNYGTPVENDQGVNRGNRERKVDTVPDKGGKNNLEGRVYIQRN